MNFEMLGVRILTKVFFLSNMFGLFAQILLIIPFLTQTLNSLLTKQRTVGQIENTCHSTGKCSPGMVRAL